jgi:zinc protease
MRRHLLKGFILLAVVPFLLWARAAFAIEIQEVKSPGGLTAWLVEDKTVPLIAMEFSFEGGSASDPQGKEGVANFLTGMMDEGAGDMDSATFQQRRDDLAVKLSFDAELDHFSGSFQTLSRNRDEAFALLKAAVTAPHFKQEPMDRVRQQFLVSIKSDAQDPDKIASRRWMEMALGSHPYARPSNGTVETVTALAPDDLRAAHKRLFSRKGLQIAVVGDISAADLSRLLDETFGGLPDTDPPVPPPMTEVPVKPALEIIDRPMPQSILVFGSRGILRQDEDFIPAYLMTHILGGGGLGSWLSMEIREKRGLTYGVGYSLAPLDRVGMMIGSLGTRNEKAGEALGLVREVLKRMAAEGPTQQELDEAKTYLTGSYALRFDSNSKIAGQLLGIQQEDLGIDYIQRRNSLIEAVTLDQVKAAAKRLLDPDNLIVAVVGKPEGL